MINNKIIIDVENKILGRISTKISLILQGKDNIYYSSNKKNNIIVIVINSSKILVTGKKYENKIYYKHTGFIGGLKKILFKDLIKKNPNYIIYKSVKGMLPKNKLSNILIKKLKIFKDSNYNNI